jgi:hypothetical protein
MDNGEREAARALAQTLAAANYIEFARRVRAALDAANQDRQTATETLWQIEQIAADLEEANRKLREHCQDLPPSLP